MQQSDLVHTYDFPTYISNFHVDLRNLILHTTAPFPRKLWHFPRQHRGHSGTLSGMFNHKLFETLISSPHVANAHQFPARGTKSDRMRSVGGIYLEKISRTSSPRISRT